MKKGCFIWLLMSAVMCTVGCALMPNRSLKTTEKLGKEIIKNEVPYLSLLNEEFSSGYALIPRESVNLSKKVGEGLAMHQAAYAQLLNRYFAQKRRQVDDWIKDVYIPDLSKKKLRRYGKLKDSETLLKETITESVQKRNAMQEELEKARLAIWENVLGSYTALRHANAELTALLLTLTDADTLEKRLEADTSAISPNEFNFSKFDNLFESYLSEAGRGSSGRAEPLLKESELSVPKKEE